MLQRILEPEVMDTPEDAQEYDAMDFTEVNAAFAREAIAACPHGGTILDAGTGTARIPLLIAQERADWAIVAIDLSAEMLRVGQQHIEQAGLSDRIRLEQVDAKQMPYADRAFDAVISNSIVHHLPDPMPFFREVKRVLKPNGSLFLRDLRRPEAMETVEQLVGAIGAEYNAYQTKLFRDSLLASFTVAEVQQMLEDAELTGVRVYESSDRHWTAVRSPA
ncbi:MAG: class I SAM-dependent methyltransferase [Coleofasciculaceae cyanobacterium SM2_3_26]|nr:class I SAM-dependent methyltransferase [Coleofasciculaceae cyanobacterium SM2_3_26]